MLWGKGRKAARQRRALGRQVAQAPDSSSKCKAGYRQGREGKNKGQAWYKKKGKVKEGITVMGLNLHGRAGYPLIHLSRQAR